MKIIITMVSATRQRIRDWSDFADPDEVPWFARFLLQIFPITTIVFIVTLDVVMLWAMIKLVQYALNP